MKQLLLLLILTGLTMSGCMHNQQKPSPITTPGQHPAAMTRDVTLQLDYLIYLPDDYGKAEKQWPLMIFLHGVGERGHDLNKVKAHGPAKLVEQGKKLSFIVVSPQCPDNAWWPYIGDRVNALIDDVLEHYSVDENRVYLTGLSMGGYGTWAISGMYPQRFAAIAPICGGGVPFTAFNLKNVPVWAFHGDKDPVVPLSQSQDMVNAVKQVGGDAKLTVYPGVGHDSWTQTYSNDELYEWLLSHSRKQD